MSLSIDPDAPTVLSCETSEDGSRILISAERSDVSLIVESHRDLDAEEVDALLDGIPESIEEIADRMGGSR